MLGTAAAMMLDWLPQRVWRSDFSHLYPSARMISHKLDPYTVEIPEYCRSEALPFTEMMQKETNPPLLIWTTAPLSRLPVPVAFSVWVGIELVSLFVVFALCIHLLGRSLSVPAWCLAAGLVLFSMPVFSHFWCSQVQLPLYALLLAGYSCWRSGKRLIASGFLTLAGMLKLFPLAVVPLPLLGSKGQGWRKTAMVIAGFLTLWFVVPGWHLWISFVGNALPYLHGFTGGRHYNFTILSFTRGLTEALYQFEPSPVASAAATTVGLTGAILLLLWTWAACHRALLRAAPAAADPCFCLLVISVLLCSPIAWAHYLVFLIYPLLCLAVTIKQASATDKAWLIILLLFAMLACNLARGDYFAVDTSLLKFLKGQAPLLAMGALYVHFCRRLQKLMPLPSSTRDQARSQLPGGGTAS